MGCSILSNHFAINGLLHIFQPLWINGLFHILQPLWVNVLYHILHGCSIFSNHHVGQWVIPERIETYEKELYFLSTTRCTYFSLHLPNFLKFSILFIIFQIYPIILYTFIQSHCVLFFGLLSASIHPSIEQFPEQP